MLITAVTPNGITTILRRFLSHRLQIYCLAQGTRPLKSTNDIIVGTFQGVAVRQS